uniref:SecY-independent transporter protein n=1 Tax=Bangia atropurpurea TaxID=31347 RepID=UPI0007C5E926|nr:SecY-independent transporter protein [Bangia atropurpurea]UNJ18836.1 SecY-independent transporter protein [Bangia atropurpurea]
MLVPLQIHLKELKFRIGYLLFSFFFTTFIILSYNESIFFLETYIFTNFGNKKFIATHVTELFFTSMYASGNLAFIANFPYTYYHCKKFLASSWYSSQMWIFSRLLIPAFTLFVLCIFICYIFILPSALLFFNTWEITVIYALKLQLETRIEIYTNWTLQTAVFLSNIVLVSCIKLVHSYLLDNLVTLHVYVRSYKKYFFILLYLFTSITVPPEGFLQIIFIILIFSFVEVLFFITCIFFAKNNV